MIETTPRDFWIPTNLLKCITECLDKLREWTKKKYCPNYFIPEENMFDKVDSQDLELLANVLEELLSNDFVNVLLKLTTSGIGEELHILLSNYEYLLQVDFSAWENDIDSGESQRRLPQNIILKRVIQAKLRQNLICQLQLIPDLVCSRSFVLIKIYSRDLEQFEKRLRSVVDEFECVTNVTEHSEEETKTAMSLFMPFIKPMLLSVEIALLERTGVTKQKMRDILRGKMWNASSLPDDFLPLKTASTLFVLGYYEDSIQSLGAISVGVRLSCCWCDHRRPVPKTLIEPQEYWQSRPNVTVDIAIKDVVCKWIFTCVPFLPAEAPITPPVIIYDCLRCLCQLPGKQDGQFLECNEYEIAFVDGQLLYPFVLYLNHSEMNHHHLKMIDILLMNAAVNTREISHKAACLNVLGWVFKREGLKSIALECFIQSIKEESERNAAYWHLLFLICE